MTRALVCTAFGSPDTLALREIDVGRPGPGEVLVDVAAAGLNHSDALMVQGHYQLKPPLPFVPGAEMAGTVVEVGAGVERLQPGQRVVASGLGAFAARCLVDARRTLALPDAIDFDTASVLTLTPSTALHALADRARLQPGESLLVLGGAGGVGSAAIQIGRALGGYVIAAASTDAKRELCRRLGADEVIEAAPDGWRGRIDELTAGRGVDVVVDPVGGTATAAALRCLAWRGRLLLVGYASGAMPQVEARHLLLRERSLLGVYLGDTIANDLGGQRRRVRQLIDWCVDGDLALPVGARVALAQAPSALLRLLHRDVAGRIVVHPGA